MLFGYKGFQRGAFQEGAFQMSRSSLPIGKLADKADPTIASVIARARRDDHDFLDLSGIFLGIPKCNPCDRGDGGKHGDK